MLIVSEEDKYPNSYQRFSKSETSHRRNFKICFSETIILLFTLVTLFFSGNCLRSEISVNPKIFSKKSETVKFEMKSRIIPERKLGSSQMKISSDKIREPKSECVVDTLQDLSPIVYINRLLTEHPHYLDLILITNSTLIDLWILYTLILWMFSGASSPLIPSLLMFYSLRFLALMLGHWPFPQRYLFRFPGLASFFIPYNKTNDFYFSGHTGILTLLCLNYWVISYQNNRAKQGQKAISDDPKIQRNLKKEKTEHFLEHSTRIGTKNQLNKDSQILMDEKCYIPKTEEAIKFSDCHDVSDILDLDTQKSNIFSSYRGSRVQNKLPNEYQILENEKRSLESIVLARDCVSPVPIPSSSSGVESEINTTQSKETNQLLSAKTKQEHPFSKRISKPSRDLGSANSNSKVKEISSFKIESPSQYNYCGGPYHTNPNDSCLFASSSSFQTKTLLQQIPEHQKTQKTGPNIHLQRLGTFIDWWFRVFSVVMLVSTVIILIVTGAHYSNDILIGFCAAVVAFKTCYVLRFNFEIWGLRFLGWGVGYLTKKKDSEAERNVGINCEETERLLAV